MTLAVNDSEEAMQAFMEAGDFSFPVMLDVDEVYRAYGISGIPTLVLVDAEGHIVDTIVGGATADELASMIEALSQ